MPIGAVNHAVTLAPTIITMSVLLLAGRFFLLRR
jgi:hypothetical protein